MSIYKNDGKYIVKLCINGKQVLRRKYLGKSIFTMEQALMCEKDLKVTYGDLKEDYLIDDLFNIFEEYLFKKYKETSAKRYLSSFNLVVKKFFAGKKVSDITRSYCSFLNDSINNLPYKSIDPYIFLSKCFLIFLGNYGLKINCSVFYKYRKSFNPKRRFNFYTVEQFNEFLSVISNKEDRLIFEMLFYYGLRCGELRGLQVKCFYKDKIEIFQELSNKGRFGGQNVFDVKTASSVRFYPYVKDIKSLFKEIVREKELKKSDFIFINKDREKVIGETSIRRKILEYSKRAKLQPIKIHEFRHSCASYLINKDVDPKDIASWLGHASVETTLKVYAHLLPSRKEGIKSIIDKLG